MRQRNRTKHRSRHSVCLPLLLASAAFAQDDAPSPEAREALAAAQAPASAPDTAEAAADDGVKLMSGMSILGNEEAPKALVIVPWKSSRLGDGIGVRNSMDDRARPVDRDVFMRELRYYEIRSGGAD